MRHDVLCEKCEMANNINCKQPDHITLTKTYLNDASRKSNEVCTNHHILPILHEKYFAVI